MKFHLQYFEKRRGILWKDVTAPTFRTSFGNCFNCFYHYDNFQLSETISYCRFLRDNVPTSLTSLGRIRYTTSRE